MSQRRCLWTPLGTQSPDPTSQLEGSPRTTRGALKLGINASEDNNSANPEGKDFRDTKFHFACPVCQGRAEAPQWFYPCPSLVMISLALYSRVGRPLQWGRPARVRGSGDTVPSGVQRQSLCGFRLCSCGSAVLSSVKLRVRQEPLWDTRSKPRSSRPSRSFTNT